MRFSGALDHFRNSSEFLDKKYGYLGIYKITKTWQIENCNF